MTLTKKQVEELIEYWKMTADHDWGTAQALWRSKRYDACLFYCHLTVEKYLKGLVVKQTNEHSPYSHNLSDLSKTLGLELEQEDIELLSALTTFNLRGRYAQDKFAFYKLCTAKFSEPYYHKTKKLIIWLKKSYQKNR